MKLLDYIGLSKHCVYALVSEKNKKFAVGYAKHLFNALFVIYRDLETPKFKQLKNDIDDIDIVVLEENIEKDNNKKILCSKYVDMYKAKGYKQYYPSHFVRYTVHTELMEYKNRMFLTVYLKDKRCNKIIVGLFTKKKEMQAFLDLYYPNNTFNNIHYSINLDTSKYLKRLSKEDI
jgi:hypothetical protein